MTIGEESERYHWTKKLLVAEICFRINMLIFVCSAKYEEHCEKQWYFFTKRNRKYSGGNRPNRGAGNGFWKQTNVNRPVFKVLKDKTKVELGRKVTLDYHDKSLKTAGQRTDWKMHEYRVNHKLPGLPSNYNTAGSSSEVCYVYA